MKIEKAIEELAEILNNSSNEFDKATVKASLEKLGECVETIGGSLLFTTLAESLGNNTIECSDFLIAVYQIKIAGQTMKKASRAI